MFRSFSSWLTAFAMVLGAGCLCMGCNAERRFRCESNADCLRGGQSGFCSTTGADCAFPSSDCPTGLRWDVTASRELASACLSTSQAQVFAEPDVVVTPVEPNACGGTSSLEGQPGAPCGPCASGIYRCDGQDALLCEGAFEGFESIGFQGSSEASPLHSDSTAQMGTDNALFSSVWFDVGQGGVEPTFRWQFDVPRCLRSISVKDNRSNEVEERRRNHDFRDMQVLVLSENEEALQSADVELNFNAGLAGAGPGTVRVELGGVEARKIELRFLEPDNVQRAGFSEFDVEVYR